MEDQEAGPIPDLKCNTQIIRDYISNFFHSLYFILVYVVYFSSSFWCRINTKYVHCTISYSIKNMNLGCQLASLLRVLVYDTLRIGMSSANNSFVCRNFALEKQAKNGNDDNLQVRFSQKGSKLLPKFTSENLKNIWLEDGCLAGVHFWHPQGPH